MRVLVLANLDTYLVSLRKELLMRLIAEGHEVYVAGAMNRCPQKLKDLGCHILDVPFEGRGTNPINDWKLYKRYRGLLKQVRPDVVLTYTVKVNAYGGWACRQAKIPYLPNVTGLGDAIEHPGLLRTLVLSLTRFGLKGASCVFFQNESNRRFFLENKVIDRNKRNRLIPGSGVNLQEHRLEAYPDSERGVRLLYIGRLIRDKGVEELFEAIDRIRQEHKQAHFTFIGDCDPAYQDRLDALCAGGCVEYHGFCGTVHPYIAKSHCVILPSYHEGISNALLEAAATGRPVIATNVAGCRETFDDGVSGLACEAKNANSLYEQIRQFLSMSHAQREEMGKAGRRKMEQEFDRNIVIDAYLQEINRIFSEKEG